MTQKYPQSEAGPTPANAYVALNVIQVPEGNVWARAIPVRSRTLRFGPLEAPLAALSAGSLDETGSPNSGSLAEIAGSLNAGSLAEIAGSSTESTSAESSGATPGERSSQPASIMHAHAAITAVGILAIANAPWYLPHRFFGSSQGRLVGPAFDKSTTSSLSTCEKNRIDRFSAKSKEQFSAQGSKF